MASPFKKDELIKRAHTFSNIVPAVAWTAAGIAAAIPWTTLDLTPFIAAWSRDAVLGVFITAQVVGAGPYCRLFTRRSAAIPVGVSGCTLYATHAIVGVGEGAWSIHPLTDAQTMDYSILVGAGWTLTAGITVYGYI